ncbi:tripartite tricarboxylate transporter permease [Chloroflexota bacterium]
MMVAEAFVEGLQVFTNLDIWFFIFAGIVTGLIFGIIPGIGGIAAMSILLPFVYYMPPEHALPLFISICAVTATGGSISAILLNIPGTTPNAATVIDGFPMTQKGEGSRALGAALTSSGMGGIIGVVLALLAVPLVLPLVYAITSADMVFIILMGLSFIAVLNKGSLLKALIAGGVGIALSFVGLHVMTGVTRFTFGTVYLISGLPLIPIVLGLFAVPQIISLAARGETIARSDRIILSMRGVVEGMKDVFHRWGLWLRSSIIGYIIGVIPGVGSSTAVFVCYGLAKQTSKHQERFGTGIVEGVIAPESANNAKEGGALLTTLALGIPGSAEFIIVLAALMMLGIKPGPEMLTTRLPLSFTILQVLFISSIIGAVICLLLAPRLVKITTIPAHILTPIVTVIVFLGTFAHEERFLSLVVLIIFSLLGLAMRKYGFGTSALLLGFILGDLFEKYLFLAYGTGGPLFFLRPISLSVIFIIIALFCYQPVRNLFIRRARRGA